MRLPILATKLLEQQHDRAHDCSGCRPENIGAQLLSGEALQVDGIAGTDPHQSTGQQSRNSLAGRENLLRAPLGNGNDGAAGGQADAGSTRLACHRPQVPVARERCFWVDDHALSGVDRLDGRPQGSTGVDGVAIDGDLSSRVGKPANDGNLEELRLAQKSRGASGGIHEVSQRQRVEMRQVVADQKAPSHRGDVLLTAPFASGQNSEQRPDDAARQPIRPLLAVSGQRGLSLVLRANLVVAMQATIKRFDPTTRQGTVLFDDGRECAFDAAAFDKGLLRMARLGQRVAVELDADGPNARITSLTLATFPRPAE